MQYGRTAEFAKFFNLQFLALFFLINRSSVISVFAFSAGQSYYIRHIDTSNLKHRTKNPARA
jgi:hypothetical protein